MWPGVSGNKQANVEGIRVVVMQNRKKHSENSSLYSSLRGNTEKWGISVLGGVQDLLQGTGKTALALDIGYEAPLACVCQHFRGPFPLVLTI